MHSRPVLALDHLVRLTDCTGIIQHAIYSLPDLTSGYTTDDNARALLLVMRLPERRENATLQALAQRYLSFLAYAQRPDGWFHNFMNYSRQFVDEAGSEDCFARAMQACAEVMAAECDRPHAGSFLLAKHLWLRGLPHIPRLRAPRAQAGCILALCRYREHFPDSMVDGLLVSLARSLLEAYRRNREPGWYWFEDMLTYANASLPQALLAAYVATGRRSCLRTARESLRFLTDCCFRSGYLKVVGNRQWYRRGGRPSEFDEQPIDAGQMVDAHLLAHRILGLREHLDLAQASLGWFHGRNHLGLPLVDTATGGCCDGLTPEGVNLNQGAESLITYLWSTWLLHETALAPGLAPGKEAVP